MINRQVLQTGWKSDEYFKTNIFVKHWELNQIFFTIYFCENPMSADWSWSWSIDPDCLEKGNDKDLKMIRCRFTWIFNPEYNLSKLFLCLFTRSVYQDKSKLNWGLMSGIYPAVWPGRTWRFTWDPVDTWRFTGNPVMGQTDDKAQGPEGRFMLIVGRFMRKA